tara:strand:+ start:953 stop:1087 length:135 start_codon:yes stop_codon:yes gene_type:complete
MDYSYLYLNEIPKGVKSIYINGKTITREEFLKQKESFLKKGNKI